jgi:hypothetical protein
MRALFSAALAASMAAPADAGSPWLRGDANNDQSIDISDAVHILAYLFLGSVEPKCAPIADASGDGQVALSDASRLLDFLFQSGAALPALSPAEASACAASDPGNLPPSLLPKPVYRTFPGFPLALRIGAVDAEGDPLVYEALDLPPGATLGPETGLLSWTPAGDQLGPFRAAFAVMDAASPPNRVEGALALQVLPLDACTVPSCDPAAGCTFELQPLAESCCSEPGPRVDEPDAGCPAGQVLHIGRNGAGAATIGRLQNCDKVRLTPLGQGGHVLTIFFEAHCFPADRITVWARLETATSLLFEASAPRNFLPNEDGTIVTQRLAFVVEGLFYENQEAQLTASVSTADGLKLERKLRVVLTRDKLPDLP